MDFQLIILVIVVIIGAALLFFSMATFYLSLKVYEASLAHNDDSCSLRSIVISDPIPNEKDLEISCQHSLGKFSGITLHPINSNHLGRNNIKSNDSTLTAVDSEYPCNPEEFIKSDEAAKQIQKYAAIPSKITKKDSKLRNFGNQNNENSISALLSNEEPDLVTYTSISSEDNSLSKSQTELDDRSVVNSLTKDDDTLRLMERAVEILESDKDACAWNKSKRLVDLSASTYNNHGNENC